MAFGEIDGNPEGTSYADRAAARAAGVHLPLQAGIAGRASEGAQSIVVSGGYEDDEDHGTLLIYTGAGGREPDGTQVADQVFEGHNLALVTSCVEGLPVRVLRGAGGEPAFSPQAGYRYDGLFAVTRYWREPGRSGFLVCRYELRKILEDGSLAEAPAHEPSSAITQLSQPGTKQEWTLGEALPFLDELPAGVVQRAAELAGLPSAASFRSQPVGGVDVTRLAQSLARACLEDPDHSLEQTSVGVVIPRGADDALGVGRSEEARIRLVTVFGLPEMGGLSARSLLAWLLELAIWSSTALSSRTGAPSANSREATPSAEAALEAVREVAGWAYLEHGETSIVSALRAVPPHDRPEPVKRALAVIEASAADGWAFADRGKYDLDQAFAELETTVGPRGWDVFVHRALSTDRRPTLEELGQELGLTRERVRQLEVQARKQVADSVGTPGNSVIRRAAERLHTAIGEVARPIDVQHALTRIDPWGEALSRHPERTRLLLDLAGPFRQSGDWVVRGHVESRAVEHLGAATVAGPISVTKAIELLQGLGVRSDVGLEWLSSLPGFRVMDTALVRWHGTMADKAYVILETVGESMTVAEVFEALGEDRSIRTLSNYLQTDTRFMRRGLEHYGLREWGGEEYTTIVEEIQQEIERQGGEATLEHLVATLTEMFGVAEGSVRTYALQHPLFALTPQGTVCLHEGERRGERHQLLEETKGCFRLLDAWALRIVVSSDTLRGSGMSIPTALARHVGLYPRGARDFESDFGQLRLTWPSIQPHMGSQRSAAIALGLGDGDRLFIEFLENKVRFHGVSLASIENTTGLARLALETGAPPDLADPLEWTRRAIGVQTDDADPLATMRRRLTARKEADLAALIPEAELADADETVLDLLASLGE